VAKEIFDEYFGRNSDPPRPGRSFEAIILSKLGVQAFSRPVVKVLGIVRIDYVQAVDTLVVGDQRLKPWPAVLLKVGPATLLGMLGAGEVCRIDTVVTQLMETKVTC
jgi:hypothetical protein